MRSPWWHHRLPNVAQQPRRLPCSTQIATALSSPQVHSPFWTLCQPDASTFCIFFSHLIEQTKGFLCAYACLCIHVERSQHACVITIHLVETLFTSRVWKWFYAWMEMPFRSSHAPAGAARDRPRRRRPAREREREREIERDRERGGGEGLFKLTQWTKWQADPIHATSVSARSLCPSPLPPSVSVLLHSPYNFMFKCDSCEHLCLGERESVCVCVCERMHVFMCVCVHVRARFLHTHMGASSTHVHVCRWRTHVCVPCSIQYDSAK